MKWFGRSKEPENSKVSSGMPTLQTIYRHCTTLNPQKIIRQPIAKTRFVVLDTETTGFQANSRDEIISIALLELNGLEKTDREYKTLINPGRPIPESSTEIHGIRDADVRDAPILGDKLADIIMFIDEAIVVGHHISFDIDFLSKHLQKLIGCSLQNPWIDTMWLYAELTGKPDHYKLDEVARASGVEIAERHTAYGDAHATADIFIQLTQRMIKPADPVSRLIAMQYNYEM